MRNEEEWAEVGTRLKETHALQQGPLSIWPVDVEAFVLDMLQLSQASYAAGYDDAMADMEDVAQRFSAALPDTLSYIDG